MTDPVIETGKLAVVGRLSWSEVRDRLAGMTACWGDIDRMHLREPLPDTAPAYTHLWAWRDDGVAARVRIDLPSGRHPTAVYVPDTASWPTDPPTTEVVEVEVFPVVGWGKADRVKTVPAEIKNPDPPLERLVTRHPSAITLLRNLSSGSCATT